jgi:PAS domain S-box-containing protein
MLNAAAAVIVAVDREGNFVRWNGAAERLTGISSAGIPDENRARSVIFPADLERWKLEIARAFGGLFSRWIEIRWNCRDAGARPLACSFSAIRDRAGKAEYVTCTAVPCHSGEFLADRALELRDIGRFVHDTVAQELAVLSCSLSPLETLSRGLPGHEDATAALEMADRCCRGIRIMTTMLAAPLAPARTVERSIEQIADYLRQEAGLVMVLDIDPVCDALTDDARMLLFTAFQQWSAEGIRRNPKPLLTVRLRERRRGIVLELETSGIVRTAPDQSGPTRSAAFDGDDLRDPSGTGRGSGWSAIRERARALGGEFDIAQGPATVRVRLMLPGSEGAR